MNKCRISEEDIGNREVVRKQIKILTDLSEEKARRAVRIVSEEESARACRRMKE